MAISTMARPRRKIMGPARKPLKSKFKGVSIPKLAAIAVLIALGIAFIPRPAEKAIGKLITTEYSVADPSFRQAMGHLTGASLVEGNRITPLVNGDEIFGAQFEAIRGARQSITLENFIFRSGKLSAQLVDLLAERSRAGVKVHVLIDFMGSSKLKDEEIERLENAGVQFVRYNQARWHKILRVNHRDHRKILVVDGRVAFTGGACLADEWMGNADKKELWRDTHFKVEGPAVAQLQGVFMDNWIQTQHEVLHGPRYFPPLEAAGSAVAHGFKTGPRDGVETARLAYLYSIAAARKNMRIAHSYFVPDDLMIDAMLEARKRGVKIEVITPGIIDANVVRRASRARWEELIKAGVEFYEYQPSLFHCKVMVVDDLWVLAGSINFDNRSFRMNDENTLNVLDKEFAQANVKIFEADKAKSRQVTLAQYQSRPWYTKAAERAASLIRVWLTWSMVSNN